MEVLSVFYSRHLPGDESSTQLVTPLFSFTLLFHLKDMYETASVNFHELDENKYTLVKKLADVSHSGEPFDEQH